MKPEEYERICRALGSDPIAAGELLGITSRTAYRWREGTYRWKGGKSPIPEPVRRFLRYFEWKKIPLEELKRFRK